MDFQGINEGLKITVPLQNKNLSPKSQLSTQSQIGVHPQVPLPLCFGMVMSPILYSSVNPQSFQEFTKAMPWQARETSLTAITLWRLTKCFPVHWVKKQK